MTYEYPTTGMTEVTCYLFLEKEDEVNIRDAIKGWKLLMSYGEEDVGGSIFIGIVSIIYLAGIFCDYQSFKLLVY